MLDSKKKKHSSIDIGVDSSDSTPIMMTPLNPLRNHLTNNNCNASKSGSGGKSVSSISIKKILPLGNLDSCSSCVRYVLVFGNCIFFLLGCTIIGLGIYVVVDKVNFVRGLFGITLVAPASYVILTSGCVVFIISFIGCFGALFESRILLAIYSTSLAVVLVLSCVGFSFSVLFRSSVTDHIVEYMQKSLIIDYGVNSQKQWNNFLTSSWNKAQKKWQCCGVHDNSWVIYLQSSWFEEQLSKLENQSNPIFVPTSCCKLNRNGKYVDLKTCQFESNHTVVDSDVQKAHLTKLRLALNFRGCFEVGISELYKISGYLIGIGVVTAIVVIGGLALSIKLARKV